MNKRELKVPWPRNNKTRKQNRLNGTVSSNLFRYNANGQTYDYFFSSADFNLDGEVNSLDKNNHWRVNNGKSVFLE